MPWSTRFQALKRPPMSAGPWQGSPHAWIRDLAPTEKGDVAVDMYIGAFGGTKLTDNGAGYDIDAGGLRVEAKLSTRSYSNNNGYLWQQIRPQDPYTHLWLIAVDVSAVRAFHVPRAVADAHLLKQHGRDAGDENTYQIKTSSGNLIPAWLADHETKTAPP